ncbi:FPGS [Bugula neritina]|uniref:tetrahydrofolate synthase n=1 Tax=Bugula neritina TaxID=10212 RepID=A0A7J7KHX8_BUGNE|nr:FPGS [Bugula neritina]
MSSNNKSFKEAVLALNSLQSNAAQIEAKRQQNKKQSDNLKLMTRSLSQVGVTLDQLNGINIVHITGTKGKGSTAALTESILRQHGYKTGFYSSPHLVEVRERIRLQGSPISQEMFGSYFWKVYDALSAQLEEGEQLPFYFKFLTLMAFKVFVSEGVNAAVIEVGIGGRYDTTNVITQPLVCGITSLGIDHTSLLGNTIEEISWQKAGIMKYMCPTVSVPQPGAALHVLHECAQEVRAPLFEAPPFDARQRISDTLPHLGLSGDVQQKNASLAVQLSRIFMERQADRRKWTTPTHGRCTLPLVSLSSQYMQGLEKCKWPGRFHKTERKGVTYYVDGAHTSDSIGEAFKWFRQQSTREKQRLEAANKETRTILMFNRTGE